jgi:predicted Zn-dependent protease with MMP-like domain
LYTGVPLTQRHVELSGVLSDAIYLYREGIFALARDRHGRFDEQELRRQIRITVLHELGHYHGLDERELRQLGY